MYTEATNIIKNEALVKRLSGYIPVHKAIHLARMFGVTGKFEVHYIMHNESERYIISASYVNEENKIISIIYP